MSGATFTLPEAARAAGATPRQLHHWIAVGLLDPLFVEGGSAGQHGSYRFTWEEARFIVAIVEMERAGIALVAIRKAHAAGTLSLMLMDVKKAVAQALPIVKAQEKT